MSLQVKNLDYQIDGKSILEQICLEVQDGEFVGLGTDRTAAANPPF